MVEFRFMPASPNLNANWDDPSVWSGGVVPNGTAAAVALPALDLAGAT